MVWRRVLLYSKRRRRSRKSRRRRRRRRRKRIIHLYSADRGTGPTAAAAVVATFSNEPHFPTDTKRKLATNT